MDIENLRRLMPSIETVFDENGNLTLEQTTAIMAVLKPLIAGGGDDEALNGARTVIYQHVETWSREMNKIGDGSATYRNMRDAGKIIEEAVRVYQVSISPAAATVPTPGETP